MVWRVSFEDRPIALAELRSCRRSDAAIRRGVAPIVLIVLGGVCLSGCSIRQLAIQSLADALSGSGATFASDDDPELVRLAVPFSLKLIESLLEETPEHEGLLLAACSGFTQYAYGFIQQEADELETEDLSAATARYDRARKMYFRARRYGLRGLDSAHAGFSAQLLEDAEGAVLRTRARDVPLLYWVAVSWAAAISISKDDPDLIADQLIAEALIDRALALDESFEDGAIHSFLISYEMARQGGGSDPAERARGHFERAMELSGGNSAAALVALAESVCVQEQNLGEFEENLNRAIAIDVDERPQWRLMNLIMQRRARWLLSRTDELFVE